MLIAFQKLNITIVIIRHVIFDKLIIKLPINILIGIRQAGVAIIGEGIRVFVGLSTLPPCPFRNITRVAGRSLSILRIIIAQMRIEQRAAAVRDLHIRLPPLKIICHRHIQTSVTRCFADQFPKVVILIIHSHGILVI